MTLVIWLIIGAPLAAFVILLLSGRRFGAAASYVGISAISLSLMGAAAVLFSVIGGRTIAASVPWFTVGNTVVRAGFFIDPLAAAMLFIVTAVSLLVQIYSAGYMKGEQRIGWYYAAISLFTTAMLSLVVADNFLQLYMSWELVGLCSYLLIGFWYEKKSASRAAMKAFIVTRIGDVGFFIGLAVLFATAGTTGFSELGKMVAAGSLTAGTATAVSLLFFCGAAGKSAQFPLHVWLPDAMEGPTPGSALIHAATMVAAGVYLISRCYFMLEAAYPAAFMTIATIGAITALLAALIAITMTDIKRVLAYSTISQLGFMMAALGVGGYTAAIFHLATHAFFKALLFLGAGSVIHGAATQNINEMGGLFKKMKTTGWTFLIGTLSLAGVFPLSGFWSKDEILSEAAHGGHYIVGAVLLFTAFLTAFYMFRLYFAVFTGESKGNNVHESRRVMTVPLIVLAVPAALLGLAGAPFLGNWFGSFIFFGEHHAAAPDYLIMGLSTIAALAGLGLSWAVHTKQMFTGWTVINALNSFAWLFTAGVDKLIAAIIGSVLIVGEKLSRFDSRVVDGLVNLAAPGILLSGRTAAEIDTTFVDGVYDGVAGLIKKSAESSRKAYTGSLSRYLGFMFAGLIAVAIFIYLATKVF
jgi:NADH-quinone oxidoreductase subunit L